MRKDVGTVFLLLSIISLLIGMFFGVIAAFQFVFPEFIREIPFFVSRPIHVSFVVAWIFLSAIGGIYFYMQHILKLNIFSGILAWLQVSLFVITGSCIGISYLFGYFGGREYWEFPVIFAIPILISWALFAWNFFRTVRSVHGTWPVYFWMWSTGIVFFFLTFSESYLWLIPWFGNDVVRDLTVQWKAYGALVGSWNMLVYGTAIFIMEQTGKDRSVAHTRLAFLMYFLGFTNLLFGWAHHLYTVPNQWWIRYFSYVISMTELIILARIIYNWRSGWGTVVAKSDFIFSRFLSASEIWIFLNLVLALAISIPAVNLYTHGTHITVAHAMGSSIGINTMILVASLCFAASFADPGPYSLEERSRMRLGFWLLQVSLVIFWLSLIAAGIYKGVHTIHYRTSFGTVMAAIRPLMLVFAIAGTGIFLGLLLVLMPVADKFLSYLRNNRISYGKGT